MQKLPGTTYFFFWKSHHRAKTRGCCVCRRGRVPERCSLSLIKQLSGESSVGKAPDSHEIPNMETMPLLHKAFVPALSNKINSWHQEWKWSLLGWCVYSELIPAVAVALWHTGLLPWPHGSPGFRLVSQMCKGWLALHKFQLSSSLPTRAWGWDGEPELRAPLVMLCIRWTSFHFTFLTGFVLKHGTVK